MDALAALLGPTLALAAGLAGWATARRWAPRAAANDNMPVRLPAASAAPAACEALTIVIGLGGPDLILAPAPANDAPTPLPVASDAAG